MIFVLTGPTASGKTSAAIEIAEKTAQFEIVNADSLLVYRGLDIGTAKPTKEEQSRVPHHLIDIRNPDETFTAGEFYREAQAAIDNIQAKGKQPLIVGGTGFYLKALIFGIWQAPKADPQIRLRLESFPNEDLFQKLMSVDSGAASRIGLQDRYRLIRSLELFEATGKTPTRLQEEMPENPDPKFKVLVLDLPNEALFARIEQRTEQMIQQGIIEEYTRCFQQYPKSRALGAIGYAQVRDFLNSKIPEGRKVKPGIPGLSEEIQLATRQLVKQQRTWLKSMTRKIPNSEWINQDQLWLNLEK